MEPWIINPYNLTEEYRICTYRNIMPKTFMISSSGIVYNMTTGNFIRPRINNDYYVINLKRTDGSWYRHPVHRLVAWEFVPYRRDYNLQVNHKDGNKLNNYYENLEWVTPGENTHHAIDNGLRPLHGGSCKLTEEIVHYICQLLENPNNSYGYIIDQVDGNYGISVCVGTIKAISLGRIWHNVASQYNIPFRNKRGECQKNSILTEKDVHFICQLHELGLSAPKIASLLEKNVSIGTITSIVQGINWKHISNQYNMTPHSNKQSLLDTLIEKYTSLIREQIYKE